VELRLSVKNGKYRLSVIKDYAESTKNREYLLEFEAKFEKLSDSEKRAEVESVHKKTEV
jgi:hypothetical protein